MADIIKGLRTFLAATTSVTSLTGTRIYYGQLPQDPEYPAIALNLIDANPAHHLTARSGLTRSLIQIDCHGDNHASAYEVGDAVRIATDHYTGAWGLETTRSAMVTGMRDLSEPPVNGSQRFNHVRSVDVVTYHTES